MKKILGLILCMIVLAGSAAADQEVTLPGGRYMIDVPERLDYSDPVDGDAGMEAYVSEDLEIDFVAYQKADAIQLGMPDTLKETAEMRRNEGAKVQIRKVNGIEMLVFRVEDEADGAPGIVYVFEDGEWLIEINFWYATQEAADETKKIMETIREV